MKKTNRTLLVIFGVVTLIFAGLIYAWSVLSAPIAAEFSNWTKAQLSMTFTIVMIVFCLGQLICGLLAKRINPKLNVFAAAILFFLGFLLTANTKSLITLYIGFGVLAGLGSGLAYNAIMSTVTKWYPEKTGLISGILLMGFGLGSFIFGKVYQGFEKVAGWRDRFTFMAFLMLIVLFICAFFVKKPEAKTGGNVQISEEGLSPGEVLKSASFWLFYIWAIVLTGAGLCVISQASGMVKEINSNFSLGTVATIVGLISIFNGIGRVLVGFLFDKLGRRWTMLIVELLFFLAAVSLIIALKFSVSALLVVGFLLTGIAYGGVPVCCSAFVSKYYGPKNYALNLPLVNTNLIIASFGSTIAGAVYDAKSSYLYVFILMIGFSVIGLLSCLGLTIGDKKSK